MGSELVKWVLESSWELFDIQDIERSQKDPDFTTQIKRPPLFSMSWPGVTLVDRVCPFKVLVSVAVVGSKVEMAWSWKLWTATPTPVHKSEDRWARTPYIFFSYRFPRNGGRTKANSCLTFPLVSLFLTLYAGIWSIENYFVNQMGNLMNPWNQKKDLQYLYLCN